MMLVKNKFALASLILFFLAIGCVLRYQQIGSYVDDDGMLHEPFALIPIGYLLAFLGLILGIASIAQSITRRKK